VHEIEGITRKLRSQKILPPHLHPIVGQPLEQTGVEVDGEHRAGGANALGQHPRHCTTASSHVEASPSLADPDCIKLSRGQRIVNLGQQLEPRPLELE